MTRVTESRRLTHYVALTAAAGVFALPVIYLVIGSFKPPGRVLDGMAGIVPTHLTLGNYRAVFSSLDSASTGYLWHFMVVSLVVTVAVVGGGLVINSMAAYALCRMQWRGRRTVSVIVLLLMMVPFESVAVPLFYMFNGQRNTVPILALPFIANAFSVYQFSTFFSAIPYSIEEAARIDGAGPWRTLFTIIWPLSKPAFASVAIVTFLVSWGSFLWPVLMVSDPAARPLPLELSVFQGQQPPDWGQILAFGVLLVAPVLLVFAFFQRWFVQGVASSAVKG